MSCREFRIFWTYNVWNARHALLNSITTHSFDTTLVFLIYTPLKGLFQLSFLFKYFIPTISFESSTSCCSMSFYWLVPLSPTPPAPIKNTTLIIPQALFPPVLQPVPTSLRLSVPLRQAPRLNLPLAILPVSHPQLPHSRAACQCIAARLPAALPPAAQQAPAVLHTKPPSQSSSAPFDLPTLLTNTFSIDTAQEIPMEAGIATRLQVVRPFNIPITAQILISSSLRVVL